MTATPTHIPAPMRSVDARSTDFSARQWIGQPPLKLAFAVGDQSGTDRAFTITARNLAGEACRGLFLVRIIVGTDADGGPGGAQTVTVATGSQVASVTANQVVDCMTDASGVLGLTVGLAAAGTRHVRASCFGVVYGSGAVSWT